MSFFSRLKESLVKSSNKLNEGLTNIFIHKKLNQESLDELEELLISADLGVKTSAKIIKRLSKDKFNKEVTSEEVKEFLAKNIAEILQPKAKDIAEIKIENKPHIFMFVGVNGCGKTTSIGKLAHYYKQQGKKVMIAACDTFRAAAVAQLQNWAERSGAEFYHGKEGQDPASVAYAAVESAKNNNFDILFIDTAGRLQNKSHLMEELNKITRVLRKHGEYYPQNTILVLDATTGQNAISQAEIFSEIAAVNGLIVTKLDGSAKGGVVVALAHNNNIPIYAIGVGEAIEDLKSFRPQDFANNLLGH